MRLFPRRGEDGRPVHVEHEPYLEGMGLVSGYFKLMGAATAVMGLVAAGLVAAQWLRVGPFIAIRSDPPLGVLLPIAALLAFAFFRIAAELGAGRRTGAWSALLVLGGGIAANVASDGSVLSVSNLLGAVGIALVLANWKRFR